MKKSPIFKKNRLFNSLALLAIVATIYTTLLSFFSFNDKIKFCLFISLFVWFVVIYIFLWLWDSYSRKPIHFKIGQANVEISIGDLFDSKYDGIKVIPFNEYFDTTVDDVIISKKSLHGQLIDKKKVSISAIDTELKKQKVIEEKNGKKVYSLGTSILVNDYLLFAFTKFDNENRAYLTANQYFEAILGMWDGVDINKQSKNVNLPLLGSGNTTRFERFVPKTIDLLDHLINSYRMSGIQIKGEAILRIVLTEHFIKEYSFDTLKERYNGL